MAIITAQRRFQRLALLAMFCLAGTYLLLYRLPDRPLMESWRTSTYVPSSFDWAHRPQKHPIPESSITDLPKGSPRQLPRIQHGFSKEELTEAHNRTQRERRDAILETTKRAWGAYREHAWGRDELNPQTMNGADTFGGWGATLVDSLDTLWIMGMKKEFAEAARFVGTIDWDSSTLTEISLFETTIRYLGGLLSAYDLSGEKLLMGKALELGDMLYAAFDTPNHLPPNAFHMRKAREGLLFANTRESIAVIGSLSLEFTRLSQITGDAKYYSATEAIKQGMERTQDSTKLPGMWPTYIDVRNGFLTSDSSFTLGASADSAYEYLSKMYELLGGLDRTYETMHTKAMDTIKNRLLLRPMLPDTDAPDILFPGTVFANGAGGIIDLVPEVQHLGCFAGGMFALGGKLFGSDEDVQVGEQLARGCAWAYESFPSGIMPEIAEIIPCGSESNPDYISPCEWNETRWEREGDRRGRFPKPWRALRDRHYFLRPEAIESIFILYRITGKKDLLDVAWRMFQSIQEATKTAFANSAIVDVLAEAGQTDKVNSMESFWIAETLKYFYLIFSEPELISLDEYVFNTEAHPFRLPNLGK